MIKPITYQGVRKFESNLYALEVASRFIDQQFAHGYYKNYGGEIAATVIGNNIAIDTGAFVVCGRMNVVSDVEMIAVTIKNGNVGYIVARTETYHPADTDNCTFLVRTAPTLTEIQLVQENLYGDETNTINKVFELPLYSFAIGSGVITNIKKLIKPIEDYATVKALADVAVVKADSAINIASANTITANAANITSQAANTKSDNANSTSQVANTKSNDAVNIANSAVATVKGQHFEMTAEINGLAVQIGEKQGTTLIINGVAQATMTGDDFLLDSDLINFDGGNA